MRRYSWLILLLLLCGAMGSGCGSDDTGTDEPIAPGPPVVTPLEPDNALQLEIDALIQLVQLPEHPDHVDALEQLADIGAPAVPAVLELLDHENNRVRVSAIFIFYQMGPPAAGAVPVLNERLLDTDEPLRCDIAYTLGRIRDLTSVPVLIQVLDDIDPIIRDCAAGTLGHIGEPASAAVPALTAALNDPDKDVRRSAASALGKMGPAAAVASPALVQTLGDSNSLTAIDVMIALMTIGPPAKAALLEGIADNPDNISFFSLAIRALGHTGSDQQTVEVLLKALDHAERRGRISTAVALGVIKTPADVIVPALVARLNDESRGVRVVSVNSLGKIGPPAKDAVPALIKILENSDRQLRASTAWTLMEIGTPEAVEAVQAAIEAFDDPWLEEFRQ